MQGISVRMVKVIRNVGSLPGAIVGLLIGGILLYWTVMESQQPILIVLAIILFASAQLRSSAAWLVAIPALLPVLDFMPWTGELLVNSFDLLILTAGAIGWVLGRLDFSFLRQSRTFNWLLTGLFVSYLFSIWNGFQYLQLEDSPAFHFYHSSLNSLRVGKGLFEALFLLPMVSFEKQQGKPIGRLLAVGMILGLTLCLAAILWERLFFPGLLDYFTNYRVTGLFSGMLLGGAFIDAYLVLAFPFFMLCFTTCRPQWMLWLGVVLFIGGLYSFLVTFTRSTYGALLVILTILVIASLKTQMERHKQLAVYVLLLGLAGAIVLPVLGGKFIAQRFATTGADLAHRFSHWSEAYGMVRGSLTGVLFGQGKGTFPQTYANQTMGGATMGRFWVKQEGDESFLHLSASGTSGDLFVRQRIDVQESGQYRVRLTLRSPTKQGDKLLVEFCQRNILSLEGSCSWLGFRIPANRANQWVTINRQFSLPRSEKIVRALMPFEVSLMNRGLKSTLDVGSVEIFSPDGNQLVSNPDFSGGFERWIFSSGNHLAWHIKNLWVSAFFEGGLLELFLISAFLAWLLYRLAKSDWRKESYAPILLASISGFLVVSVFDSVFDSPRISFLFFLLAWFILLNEEN